MTNMLKYTSLLTGVLLFVLFIISFQFTLQYIYKSVEQLPIHRFWFFSLPYWANVLGATCFATLGKTVGSKWGLICNGLLYTSASIAAILETFQLVDILLPGILYWITVGGALVLIPIYFSEVCCKYIRGTFISFIYVATNSAICLMNFVGVQQFHSLVPIVTMMVLGFVLTAQFFVCGEETLHNKNISDTNSTTITLEPAINVSTYTVNFELAERGAEKIDLETKNKRRMLYLADRSTIKALITVGGLSFLSSEIGIFNPTISAARTLYEHKIGWKEEEIYSFAIRTLAISMLVGTIICTSLVDKLGRKVCLYISCIGTIISLILIGSHPKKYQETAIVTTYLSGIGGVMFSLFYNFGLRPVTLILVGEMFSSRYKSVYVGIMISIQNIVPIVENELAMYPSVRNFVVWKTLIYSLIALVFIKFCVTETKGLSLEEIQKIIRNDRNEEVNANVNLRTLSESFQESEYYLTYK